jgi:hypothetical protein
MFNYSHMGVDENRQQYLCEGGCASAGEFRRQLQMPRIFCRYEMHTAPPRHLRKIHFHILLMSRWTAYTSSSLQMGEVSVSVFCGMDRVL